MIAKNLFLPLSIFILISCSKTTEVQRPITPSPGIPTVTTSPVTSITQVSAVSGGTVTSDSGSAIIEKGVCWDTILNPAITGSRTIDGAGMGLFTSTIGNLSPNTTYYVRAYAKNSAGVGYGESQTFQTLNTTGSNTSDAAATLYVSGGYSKKLFALNATDGSTKWSYTLPDNVMSSPMYANGMVYVGCGNNRLYAFDTAGTLKWDVPVTSVYLQSAIVSNGIVYFPDGDHVNAFNAATGNLIWQFTIPSIRNFCNNIDLVNNTIYTNVSYVYAIDAISGRLNWQYYTGSTIQPQINEGKLYVPHDDLHKIDVLNANNGSLLWSTAEDYDMFAHVYGLNIKNGNLFCVNENTTSKLHVLDASNGNLRYSTGITFLLSGSRYLDDVNPIVADNYAFVNGYTYNTVHNASNGTYLYTLPSLNATYKGPVTVHNNLAYYTLGNVAIDQSNGATFYYGLVIAYDYTTNTIKWRKDFLDVPFITAFPCVVANSGKVYRGGKEFVP